GACAGHPQGAASPQLAADAESARHAARDRAGLRGTLRRSGRQCNGTPRSNPRVTRVVVIPAFNAARHIEGVLERLERLSDWSPTRVIVVNDGSTDATRERILAARYTRAPLLLVDRAVNGGYGAAMKDGLAAAIQGGAELVACVHADGQYSPEALPRLAAALERRQLDLLQGSRILSG